MPREDLTAAEFETTRTYKDAVAAVEAAKTKLQSSVALPSKTIDALIEYGKIAFQGRKGWATPHFMGLPVEDADLTQLEERKNFEELTRGMRHAKDIDVAIEDVIRTTNEALKRHPESHIWVRFMQTVMVAYLRAFDGEHKRKTDAADMTYALCKTVSNMLKSFSWSVIGPTRPEADREGFFKMMLRVIEDQAEGDFSAKTLKKAMIVDDPYKRGANADTKEAGSS